MTSAMLLAVVLGAGVVPIPESVQRFPDPSYWPGVGVQQVGNMLQAIVDQAGSALRTSGPGPQQLLARWQAGELNAAERVSVLLAGATFHDPVLLPIYADALRSTELRERKAAAVGLAWLIGERPPDPNAIPDTPHNWSGMALLADALARTTKRHTLVQVWVRSLLVAQGEPRPRGLVLRRTVRECLAAIGEIAEPDDLNDLIDLWPHLDRQEQLRLLKTFEIVMVRRFFDLPTNPQAPTGAWLDDLALFRLDNWIAARCRTVDGRAAAMRSIAHAWGGARAPSGSVPLLLGALTADYPPLWPVPAELLTAFGGPAVSFDRQWPDDPKNGALAHRIREYFDVSMTETTQKPARIPRRR